MIKKTENKSAKTGFDQVRLSKQQKLTRLYKEAKVNIVNS